MSLADSLSDAGRWVHEEASLGVREDLLPGERYFTDGLGLLLHRRPKIAWYPTPGYEESRKGCDFEVLLRTSDGRGWWPIAVQAKRHYPSGNYEHLKREQLETLERYAQATGSLPAYCLYNHSVPADWQRFWTCSCRGDRRLLAWSLVPSWRVRMALETRGAREFKFLHSPPASIAFRCLLHRKGWDRLRGSPEFVPDEVEQSVDSWPWEEIQPYPELSHVRQRLSQSPLLPRRILLLDAGEEEIDELDAWRREILQTNTGGD